jgi:hypothetical protein
MPNTPLSPEKTDAFLRGPPAKRLPLLILGAILSEIGQ